MKFEAKAHQPLTGTYDDDGCAEVACTTNNWASIFHIDSAPDGYQPKSVPEAKPWRRISKVSAESACQSLGSNYILPSNNQWMTIAHNLENVASNWSSGTVGSGFLKRGLVTA